MFILVNVLIGFAKVLEFGLNVYTFILIGRAIVSWVNADPRNPIVQFFIITTEPPLRAIRRLLPANLRYFPLDVAFLTLFALVIFAQYAVVQTLMDIAMRLRRPDFT